MANDDSEPVDIGDFSVAVVGTDPSRAAWTEAWRRFLHFTGDPFEALAAANRDDDTFAAGPLFVALYSVLGATSPTETVVADSLALARERTTLDEADALGAVESVVAGNFGAAADRFASIAVDRRDFAAARYAHDLYLHAGDAGGRVRLAKHAVREWPLESPGGSYVAGQYAFALEEVGEYAAAEAVGRAALDADPDDLWARHALAHVYESTDDQSAALDLLEPSVERWSRQDALATHVWWHLGLRYLRDRDTDRVWSVFDTIVETATTPYRLADATSLLWRLELAGVDVSDRWDDLADRWAATEQRHTSAFIDVHAAFVFARRPHHDAAYDWLHTGEHPRGFVADSENDRTFRSVVTPLVASIAGYGSGEHGPSATALRATLPELHRIGGSVAQRDIIALTIDAADRVDSASSPSHDKES